MSEQRNGKAKGKVNFLDLDALNVSLGKFKVNGVEYDVMPLTLEGFINLNALPDELDEEGEDDDVNADKMDRALDVFQQVLPEVPKDEWKKLTISQLNSLMEWVNKLGNEEISKNSTPRRRAARSR